jgi:DNA repair exonuclease SbcCD ATPase subunit
MAEEENLKLKFLELEKRFVELEMNVSKINESLKKLEATKLNEVLERFEEIEDLVTIENAAVVELKELLERTDTEGVRKELEETKKSLEDRFNSLASTLEENLENIRKGLEEMKGIKVKVEEELNRKIPSTLFEDFVKLGNEFSFLKAKISSLEKQLDEVYAEVKLVKPELVKEALSKITEVKVSIEEKMNEVEKLITSISTEREEIKKITSIEERMSKVNSQLSNFSAELEKLNEKIEEDTKKFATKNDIENIAKKYVNIEDFSSLLLDFKKLQQEFDKSKQELLNTSSRDEIQSLVKEVVALREEIQNVKKELIQPNIIQQIANKLSLLEAKIGDLEKRLETKVRPIILE